RFGVMLIARAKGKGFQAINAAGRLTLDAIPPKPPSARSSKEAGI
ncbi:MAG TPA: sulfurtransferase FdhD, partial [Halomonas sp.]|nr:sulfurtransferase FdhD [Halomonas sp.]